MHEDMMEFRGVSYAEFYEAWHAWFWAGSYRTRRIRIHKDYTTRL